jgi:hypothetical protein
MTELNVVAGLYCLLGCAFVYFALVAGQRETAPKLGAGTAINAGE